MLPINLPNAAKIFRHLQKLANHTNGLFQETIQDGLQKQLKQSLKTGIKNEKTQQEIEDEPIEEVEYYKSAFALLDKEGKLTWNWCAFLFGSSWALYRKMYLYSFLGVILLSLLVSIIEFIVTKSITPEAWESSTFGTINEVMLAKASAQSAAASRAIDAFIEFVSLIFWHVTWGYFGNALYYRTVKKRIEKGDHLLNNYRPTSFGECGVDILRAHLCPSEIILLAKSTFRCMH